MTDESSAAPARPGRRRLLAAATGLVLVVAAVGWTVADRAGTDATVAAVAKVSVSDGPEAGGTGAGHAQLTDDPGPVSSAPVVGWLPRRVAVPALGISAPVVPISTEGSTLVPPDDPKSLGWWREGARPGADRGSALLTGHTVHDGGGALDDLERVRAGQSVVVRTDRGSLDYVVRSVQVLGKDVIARRAASLFSQDADGRLVLVTCEDWDGEGYRSNVVVIAVPA